MEITSKNFKSEYSKVITSIEKCRFISLDTEFSALSVSENLNISLFDDTPERYDKIRRNCEQLIPVQIGISCFTFDKNDCSYTADVFTFFIFPRTFAKYDRRFTCQASSLQFLCENNFDFNKLMYEGIPYINRCEEQVVLQNLKEGTLSNNFSHFNEIENILSKQGQIISKWIYTAQNGDVHVLTDLEKYKNNYDVLYAIHKELRNRFNGLLWTYEEDDKFKVQKVLKEDLVKLLEENNLDNKILLDVLGFTRMFRALVSSRKPLIGHNLLTDLMLLIHNFESPLPKSYSQFKKLVKELFPAVYDTKCLSFSISKIYIPEGKRWQQNTLNHLYYYFKGGEGRHLANNSPLIQLNDSLEKHDNFHNAGWDCYCTGYIFIRMAHIYATNRFKQNRKFVSNELFSAVSDFKNKVNLIRATLSHIQLDGDDPISSRPPYLIVESSKSRTINISQIASLFSSCGYVEVKPFSFGRKAIVAVDNFRSANKILKKFENHKEICVQKYSTLKHSPFARAAVWSSLILTGALLAWITNTKLKGNLRFSS